MITIDKTFILSLRNRYADRLVPLINHLQELDFKDYKIYEAIKDEIGAFGLIRTIYNLFTESLCNGLENILVLEDDVIFLKPDINSRIESLLKQLPETYDCLFFGCNLWQTIVYKYSPNLIQLYDAYGTQSVLYSKSGMGKIVKAIEEMKGVVPLDILIKEKVMPDGNVFCAFPSLTSQIVSYSDIENKVIDWSKILELRFEERTKHLKNNLE